MSKVIERLTEKDIELIDARRESAAGTDCATSCEKYLEEWASNKDKFLGDLFGDTLIIERPFEYTQSESALEREFDMAYRDDDSVIRSYLNMLRIAIDRAFPWEISYQLSHRLITSDSLAKNSQKLETFKVDFPNGKTFTFQKGSRLIRSITKIANALGIDKELTQQFVNEHSRLLNQKHLKGTLCLSIHPMDYMTMSDNREGWGSCMSWDEEGEYRAGTLEMMNSDCVVVAYLKSDRDYKFGWGANKGTWNSKKWRSLIVVDEKIIATIKSYPYENDSISIAAVDVLRELMDTAYGYNFTAPQEKPSSKDMLMYNDKGQRFEFCFHTELMYNDFGCGRSCYASLNNDYPYVNDKIYDITYSGEARCLICGGWVHNTDSLMCDDCDPRFVCTCCGEHYYDGENGYYDDNGEWWCECCYHDNHVETLPYDEYHRIDDCSIIYIDIPGRVRDIHDMPYFYIYDDDIRWFTRDYGEFHTVSIERTAWNGQTYTDDYKAIWYDELPDGVQRYNAIMNCYSYDKEKLFKYAQGGLQPWL